jgi:hypothetical protein
VEAALLPLVSWHRIILGCAALVGLEGPALLLVAVLKRRPWFERLLAVVPAVACLWMLTVAREVAAAYQYWHSYLTFQLARYPLAFEQHGLEEARAAVPDATRLGWIVWGGTAGLAVLGCALLVRWYPRPSREPAIVSAGVDSAAPSATGDDDLEIVVEALEMDTSV